VKLTITYTADADKIAGIIKDLPDVELAKLADVAWLVPELFPSMTGLLIAAEATGRRLT
jgi:hypothetical protein